MKRSLVCVLALAAAGCGSAQRPVTTAAPPPAAVKQVARHGWRPSVEAQRAALDRLRGLGRPVYCAAGRRRLVALTFDDGPGPYTRLALKELDAAHARATFFIVSKSILSFTEWPAIEAKGGAAIGDHTATHPVLPAMTHAGMVSEITDGQRAAEHASHMQVRLFRPPYGAFDRAVTRTAQRLGMTEILWSVDSGDSISGNFHVIAERVRQAVRPGAIVLFHENRGQTIRALRSLLPWLKRHHYRTATVPELLAADPPSEAQLRRGEKGCER